MLIRYLNVNAGIGEGIPTGEKKIELFAINRCWADYLSTIESALDEVKIISLIGNDPFLNYNQKLIKGFKSLENRIYDMILEIIETLKIKDGHIDLDEMGIKGPSSTRTYMVNDGTEQLNQINELAAVSNPLSVPLYALYLLTAFFDRHLKRKK